MGTPPSAPAAASALPDDFGLAACAFCEQPEPLQQSHIIPGFVFEWLRRTSATGHIRGGAIPDRRAQDGWKPRLLCQACETMFSGWETPFSERLFRPVHEQNASRVPYGPWMLCFAASVSWRVLTAFRLVRELVDEPPGTRDTATRAANRWRDFLRGDAPDVGAFEQHMLPLGLIESTTLADLPPTMNRFFTRSIDMEVVQWTNGTLVYAKLGHLLLLGVVTKPHPAVWKGSTVLEQGTFGGITYEVPSQILDFLVERARGTSERMRSLSERQSDRIAAAVRASPERLLDGDMGRAIARDIEMFGARAFRPPRDNGEKD